MQLSLRVLGLSVGVLLAGGEAQAGSQRETPPAAAAPVPLPRAHAHNDYLHARPLLEALERGYCNIEADVWLVNGALLVAHDRKDLAADRSLEGLYLDPLLARVRENRGQVYPGGPPVTLLVDIKSDAESTYAALHALLARYVEMLTVFRVDGRQPGAVTVVVSGNRSEATMALQRVRFAAMDGRKVNLDSAVSADLIPWISENWRQLSAWDWTGPMPDAVRVALGEWVSRAHARGRQLRFWNVPDRPQVWGALLDAGVDVIGTDNLVGLQQFLLARNAAPRPPAAGSDRR
jgi:hypothetical protein